MNKILPKDFTVVVLAAGQGTRMKSSLPKVLHPVGGRPMLWRLLQSCKKAGLVDIRVVVPPSFSLIKERCQSLGVSFYPQAQRNGTASALMAAKLEDLKGENKYVLVVHGDHPCIRPKDFQSLMEAFQKTVPDLGVVTATLENPGKLGRIVRKDGAIYTIVEVCDASPQTLKIPEICTGIYIARAGLLNNYLPQIGNENAKKEFYLTDIVNLAVLGKERVETFSAPPPVAMGVNTQRDLMQANRFLFLHKAFYLLEQGVSIIDPYHTYIEEEVSVGSSCVIYPGTFLRGSSTLESHSFIEPNNYIFNSQIGAHSTIKASCYIEDSIVGKHGKIGPFAHLRNKTELGEHCEVGNFVEMKSTQLGSQSKAKHLSYLGDSEVGQDCNIGCGTITCNYAVDRKKYKSRIEDEVFVGSGSQLVAPIHIGKRAIIASGTTVTKDVPSEALALARSPQVNKKDYASRFYKAKDKEKKEKKEKAKDKVKDEK